MSTFLPIQTVMVSGKPDIWQVSSKKGSDSLQACSKV